MSERMTEFFILEASDYADRLEQLSEPDAAPAPEELRRVARALRGVAQLNEFTAIAKVAQALEHAAQGLQEGRLTWNEAVRRRLAETVADLRMLVRGVRSWDEELSARAAAACARWEDAAPTAPAERELHERGAEARVAEYVASELRNLAAHLREVVQRLEVRPGDEDALREVVRRAAALAGAAWLDRFAAASELVHALEAVTRSALSRARPVTEPWLDFYRVAARVAEEAAAAGGEARGGASLERLQHLAALLGAEEAGAGAGEEVVPIESLYYDDEGPHVLEYGGAAASREEVPIEVRNFFLIEATSLMDRAQGLFDEVVRSRKGDDAAELRTTLHELARTFGWFQFGDTARAVRSLAEHAASMVSDPARAGAFGAALRELRAVVEQIDQPGQVAARTRRITEVLGGAEAAEVEAAAPEDTREAVAAPPASREPPVPQRRAPVSPEETVVPIAELLYSGPAALARAGELRSEVGAALERGDLAALEARLSELFDLIELARS